MKDLLKLILGVLASLFKSRARLEAEILILVCTENLNPDVMVMKSAKDRA
jgi:hypothetical protein